MREEDLKKMSRKQSWKNCAVCGILLKGQTREIRIGENKWVCFRCANEKG